MTMTIKLLNEMFRIWGDCIDKPLQTYLLATYEEDPFPNEWSEQDLYEQTRKLIFQYEKGELDITIPSRQERDKLRYESLKDNYLELSSETIHLREKILYIRSVVDASTDDSVVALY